MPKAKSASTGGKNGFPKKYVQVLGEEWMDEVDKLDANELKKIIVEAEQSISVTENTRDADEKLKAAKEMYGDLSSAYKDATKYQTAKIKYALMCLEGQGKV